MLLTTEYGEVVFNETGYAIACIWKTKEEILTGMYRAKLVTSRKTDLFEDRESALSWIATMVKE